MTESSTPPREFDDWIREGIERGWCGPPCCQTHDGTPYSHEEEDEFEEGNDPCLHIVRLYEDAAHKDSVESNHSPSVWRNTYSPKGFETNPVAWPDSDPELREAIEKMMEEEKPWKVSCCCGHPEKAGVHIYPAGGPMICKTEEP